MPELAPVVQLPLGLRVMQPLWATCDRHQVLVRIGTECSACVADSKLSLRGEHFEIGEARAGWAVEPVEKSV